MKLWVDDVRSAPAGYLWAKSVNDVKKFICDLEAMLAISSIL